MKLHLLATVVVHEEILCDRFFLATSNISNLIWDAIYDTEYSQDLKGRIAIPQEHCNRLYKVSVPPTVVRIKFLINDQRRPLNNLNRNGRNDENNNR